MTQPTEDTEDTGARVRAARDPGDGAGQAVLSGALGLLIAGLVVALALVPTGELVGHPWLIRIWMFAGYAVFAVTVAIRGRSIPRRVLAFVLGVGVLAAEYWWYYHLMLRVFDRTDPDTALGGIVFVLPAAVTALALGVTWGVARRRGLMWLIGPMLAAVTLAVLLHEDVLLDHLPGRGTAGDIANALVVPVTVWVGCLIGWVLDKATVRERSSYRVYPAIGHSDSPLTQERAGG